MQDCLSQLLPELWLNIAVYLRANVINILCNVSKALYVVVCSEEVSKNLLVRDYSFASPEKLITWPLAYNPISIFTGPYRETYRAVHRRIKNWCAKFFNGYSICDTRYMRKDLMLEDTYNKVVTLVERGILPHTVDWLNDSILFLLSIVSGIRPGRCLCNYHLAELEKTLVECRDHLSDLFADFEPILLEEGERTARDYW